MFLLEYNLQTSYPIKICLFCLAGIDSVPENEHLTITKVDKHGRPTEFIYRSNPATDKITVSEYPRIINFVGFHPKRKWLKSVLWLLSELAVKQFGKGR